MQKRDMLTEDDCMLRLPVGSVRQYTDTFQHDTDSQRVVRGTWTGQGAVEMRVHKHGIGFACIGAVGDANNDVRQIAISARELGYATNGSKKASYVLYSRFPIMSKLWPHGQFKDRAR